MKLFSKWAELKRAVGEMDAYEREVFNNTIRLALYSATLGVTLGLWAAMALGLGC